jgi:hypothetical protein
MDWNRRVAPALTLLTALAIACSDEADNESSGPQASDSGCDGQGDTFSANMSRLGKSGVVTFVIVDSNPSPPQIFDNVWRVRLEDASGSAIEEASILVTTWMPAHGHGSPKQTVVSELGAGEYELDPVNLPMPGLWEITLDATLNGGSTDSATFSFCIEG